MSSPDAVTSPPVYREESDASRSKFVDVETPGLLDRRDATSNCF
jgi:hypothetical protein